MKPLRFKMWEDSRREYKMKTHTSEYRAAVPIWSGEVTRELTVTQQIGVMWHVFKLLRTAVISTNSFPRHSSPPKSVYQLSHISWLFVSWIKVSQEYRLTLVWRASRSTAESKQPNLAEFCRVRLSRLLYWTGVFFLLSFKTCLRNECSQCHHQLFFYPPERFMIGRPMSLVGRFDRESHFFDKLDNFDNFVIFTNNNVLVL